VLSAYLQPLSIFLNGVGRIKEQAIIALSMAVVNLALSIVLVIHFGVIGAILGTIISEIVIVLVPGTIIANRALSQLRGKAERIV
jgi:O-antigen/teichoic acid export membrane protein